MPRFFSGREIAKIFSKEYGFEKLVFWQSFKNEKDGKWSKNNSYYSFARLGNGWDFSQYFETG